MTGLIVAVDASLADREEALEGLQGALFVGGPLALLLASALGYGLAGAALRPVELMRRRAQEISTADAGTRLPVPEGRDEIHRLAVTLNEMLERLAESAERERAFVANASHELRTPLAAIRAELELAVRHAGTVQEFRDAAVAAIRDGDGLSRLADDLLVLARADNGALPMHAEDVDVPELLRAVADEAEAGERAVRVGAVEAATAYGDPVRIQQALRNMIGNAVVHGDGTITLSAERHDGTVELRVTDQGPPVDPDTLATAFDRFARGTVLGGAPRRRPRTGHRARDRTPARRRRPPHQLDRGSRLHDRAPGGDGIDHTLRLRRGRPCGRPQRRGAARRASGLVVRSGPRTARRHVLGRLHGQHGDTRAVCTDRDEERRAHAADLRSVSSSTREVSLGLASRPRAQCGRDDAVAESAIARGRASPSNGDTAFASRQKRQRIAGPSRRRNHEGRPADRATSAGSGSAYRVQARSCLSVSFLDFARRVGLCAESRLMGG